ncbi:MAG: hypothetical protein AAF721_25745 [Myxococcota bacterium]
MLGIVVEGNLALSLLCLGGTATTVAATRLVRQRARRAGLSRRLAEMDVDLPLDTGHLSPGLANLTCQARTLRLVLATPLQRIPEGTWRDTPWRRRQRCDEYDRALVDARRALWDWLRCARRLPLTDRAVLATLGLSLRAVAGALFAPGVLERTSDPWEDVLFPAAPDYDTVSAGLCEAMHDLSRLEVALLSVRADPYR